MAGVHAVRQGARTPRAAIVPEVPAANTSLATAPPVPAPEPTASRDVLPSQTGRDKLLPNFDGEPLALRIDGELRSPPSLSLSRLDTAAPQVESIETAVIQ